MDAHQKWLERKLPLFIVTYLNLLFKIEPLIDRDGGLFMKLERLIWMKSDLILFRITQGIYGTKNIERTQDITKDQIIGEPSWLEASLR
jgi:hypothetical protein